MVTVIGPTRQFYESLLPDFRCAPEPKDETLAAIQRILATMREGVGAIAERWNIETLKDDGVTSAENNSSAILLVRPAAGRALLFTADAGIPALTLAADTLDASGFDYSSIRFIQVPHHGSRRNVGPTILGRLLGPIKMEDKKLRTAYVSASKDGAPKHPAKKVTNAFRRTRRLRLRDDGRISYSSQVRSSGTRGLHVHRAVALLHGSRGIRI
jgi:beta-lactamase superfamily II metal-dependent hydrolase